MDNSEMLDEKHDISTNAYVLSNSSFKGSDTIGNESVLYEKFLLDDLDNYWDELTDRLTVSRMVSDSVIKGLVNAVIEESAEKLASKEAEIAILNEKLRAYDDNLATDNTSALHDRPLEANVKLDCIEDLGRLKRKAEEHIQKLKEDIKNARVSSSTGQVNSLSCDLGLCTILPQAMTNEKLMDTYERVGALGTIVEELFKKVSEMFHTVKASAFEQQWANKFKRQIDAIVIHSSVRSLQDEFETKLYEHRSLISMLNKNWQQKVNELSSMRDDLDSISQTLSSSESGLLSYNGLDNFDEWNTSKRKDNLSRKVSGNHHLPCIPHNKENGITTIKQSEDYEKLMLEVADSSQLKHMDRDELAAFYKSEMIKMRRQHDSALQEKTEEIFKLKRDFLRDKGSSLFKKDKELELLKKKILEAILKLDVILLEKEKLPIIQDGHAKLSSLKDNIDTLHSENQHLRDLLREKTKEANNLSLQVSNAASQILLHSSAEAKFLHQIKKLKGDLKEMKLEVSFQNELYSIILKEVIGEKKCVMEDLKIGTRIAQNVYATGVRGFISDCMSTINAILLKYFTEKSSLKILLCEKENALCMEVEEKRKLKETLTSLSTLMKEIEKYASETDSTLMQQREQFELLNQEVDMLREQLARQEVLISNNKVESDSIKRILDQALQQIHQSEMEVKRLNEDLLFASNALEEAGRETTKLHRIINDKENKLLSSITKEKQQAKLMDSIAAFTTELSKASIDFENNLAEKIKRNETRLKNLSRQCRPLAQQANVLPKRALLYKQMLEIRSSNLQKAEAEVDLLGDEVDALLSLLGKIYVALDHYSPVLQHYSGVMEILKLVQRELEGETTRPV